MDANNKAYVNVPWTDSDTTYSMMTSSTLGLGKLFSDTEQSVAANSVSATASRTYGVQANSSDQLVINVPWTDNNTTYSAATSSTLGLMKLEDDTEQTVAANAVSSTASRTYGIQFNSSDQAVVNVPWTDNNDNTTYTLSAEAGGSNSAEIKLTPSTGSATGVEIEGTSTTIKVTEDTATDKITLDFPNAVTITTSLYISGTGASALNIS